MTDQLSLFAEAVAVRRDDDGLPDRDARTRISSDLHTSLLVEAGAGAGKTTELVRRMVALVRSGTARVDEIAAVTFTRKAAAELRERFQTGLERELRTATRAGAADVVARLDAGLRQIDRAFLGTIHAFCARLLRERPLDAGLDPAFRETLGAEEARLSRNFWHTHLERLAREGDPSLLALQATGLEPSQLFGLYEELSRQPDVEFVAPAAARPDPSSMRRRIEGIMDRAVSLLPTEEPPDGWDRLQTTLRMLRFHRFVLGWADDARFLDVLSGLGPSSFTVTKRRWRDGDAAKALQHELAALFEEGGAVAGLLAAWWAYRYPVALAFAGGAARAWERERRTEGTLNFQDLLMLAARLLRDSPAARRELSDRYRFLLVDEFQDTDPIQAEVLFLLASDEELDLFAGAAPGDVTAHPPFASWRHLTPRPGALFVVGDPKQSIYRFRRADMTLYQQVRRRFETFGAVLELTANFRSREAIERFVNETFEARFPAESTDVQARFAPMRVQPLQGRDAPVRTGVSWYELDDPVHSRVPQLARQDSERVATWIAARIDSGERRPGDFLVLTPTTRWLGRYAAALEARDIPVQVTGAGVAGRENVELEELRLLLRCLSDPGDPSLVVAVLTGLFHGLDYEQITRHVEACAPGDDRPARAPFSFTAAWADPQTPVEDALAQLNEFWRLTRRLPADTAVPEIVDRLGLLPFAAAGELGESRAGALLFALDAMRNAAIAGDASLAGALAALDAALDEDDSEAPLEPGRSDVVRVMNLHKAKGLESPVVVLAMPFGDWSPMPTSRVVRDATGRATGFATVSEPRGRNQVVTLAQPADWDLHAAEEDRFARAEDERLLYVAATRAGEELVVGCAYNTHSPSPWRSFHGWLKQHGTPLELPQPARAARRTLHTPPDRIREAIAGAVDRRNEAARPTYRAAAVTERKRDVVHAVEDAADAALRADRSPTGRGTDWGTAVHDALMYAARGMAGERLRDACRNRLVALERPVDAAGEPVELDDLLSTVAAVVASPLWQRAAAAPQTLIEVPFAVRFTAAEYAAIMGGDTGKGAASAVEIVDGRIDLVFRDAAGWVIIDYKSDVAGTGIPADLKHGYDRQLALYVAAWERLTGEPVAEACLLFTATGEVDQRSVRASASRTASATTS